MRFNPPPNWPQPPAGWTPPQGWEPDPSWPDPPSGWRLWVADDEFVITPYRAATARSRSSAQPWHQRTVTVVLMLIFFFPVGVVLLWLRHDWSIRRRGFVTAVVGIAVIIAAVSPKPPPTTTTVLGPTSTSAGATASASPTAAVTTVAASTSAAVTTDSSSQSATPSSAVTTQPRTALTSAPSKTTTAAARTSAAPVHTTKAPQPVKTTAPVQGCSPRTSSGNCYKPGEFCSKADHNMVGTDANGDEIKCEDNNGWRWERV